MYAFLCKSAGDSAIKSFGDDFVLSDSVVSGVLCEEFPATDQFPVLSGRSYGDGDCCWNKQRIPE